MTDLEWLRSRMFATNTTAKEVPSSSRKLKSGAIEATIQLDGSTMLVRGLMRSMNVDHDYIDATTFGDPDKVYLVRNPTMRLEIELDGENGWVET